MPNFVSGGLVLHYVDRGRGDPVLLLHGFTSSFAGTWQRTSWVDSLIESGRRVVGLDFPSHGASEANYDAERCTPERLYADAVALLDQVGVDRADVLGFSMGAGVALRIAMTQRQRVGRVVVGGIGDAAIAELHDPEEIAAIAAAFRADEAKDVRDPAAARIRRNAELAGASLRALVPYLERAGWPGGLDELLPIEAPVLLFVAEDDQYMAGTQRLERWLGDAEVVRLRGRDHHSALRDDELRRRALAFLAHPARGLP